MHSSAGALAGWLADGWLAGWLAQWRRVGGRCLGKSCCLCHAIQEFGLRDVLALSVSTALGAPLFRLPRWHGIPGTLQRTCVLPVGATVAK